MQWTTQNQQKETCLFTLLVLGLLCYVNVVSKNNTNTWKMRGSFLVRKMRLWRWHWVVILWPTRNSWLQILILYFCQKKRNWSIDVCRESQVTVISCVFFLTLDLNRLVIKVTIHNNPHSILILLHIKGFAVAWKKKGLTFGFKSIVCFLSKEEHLKYYGRLHISIPRETSLWLNLSILIKFY